MAIIQTLIDCVEVCAKRGIKNVILCPGSRNAALIVAFEQNSGFNCYSISDERTAAFIGVGMAIETKKPTAIVCTSGTAALNFIPASAEAIFQEIPLLILTADRPPEWIDQYDGQTVFQENAFSKHVKKAYTLVPDYDQNPDSEWFANRVFNEAISLSLSKPAGPVHINIPIREPFYPKENETVRPSSTVRVISENEIQKSISSKVIEELSNEIHSSNIVWIVVGQQNDEKLNFSLKEIRKLPNVLIIGDIISNIKSDIHLQDILFKNSLIITPPDLLVTCGKSLISKGLKLFLRNNKVQKHWHIQETEIIRDPYQSMMRIFKICPAKFFGSFELYSTSTKNKEGGVLSIIKHDEQAQSVLKSKLTEIRFSDISCVNTILPLLKENSTLHLGNSLSVRYANLLKYKINESITVECNRGTSGIEGTLSTAIGQAICSDKPVYCLLGDVSFQYDKNALWHNYIPPNLTIFVLNNRGGNIFRMISGPKKQSAYEEFFETKQYFSAEKIAGHYGISYKSISSKNEHSTLNTFLDKAGCKIIEFYTQPTENEKMYKFLMSKEN